jgi:plastocyanin
MRIVPLFACLAFASSLPAATLEGTFTFEQAPRVALVYFSEDTSLETTTQVVVDQKDKEFTEVLVIVPPGGALAFRNSDDVQHNVFADDKETGVSFDIGLANPQTTSPQPVTWKEGQVVRCGCKIHPKMQMWVAAITSRHSKAVAFTPGATAPVAFTLGDVPAKYRKVRVWTPRFESQEVELAPGVATVVEFKRKDKVFGTLNLILK